jgi:hypothetical protein
MNNKWFILRLILILTPVLYSSCGKETNDLAPGISIYKTRGDYFNLATIGMKNDEIFRTTGYLHSFGKESCKLIVQNGDTINKYRHKLAEGYVLDGEADERYDVFLSLSFKDYLNKEISLNVLTLPHDTLKKYILDRDPYIEFYRNKVDVRRFEMEDSLEINELIKNGTLEAYFEKVK